jgi:LAO/AO transport system kinase
MLRSLHRLPFSRPSLAQYHHLSTTATSTTASSTLSEKNTHLAEELLQGNRASLAKAITLIESSRSDHQHQADLLLGYLAKQCKNSSQRFQHGKTLRLGFAGPPGGKLSFAKAATQLHNPTD